MQHRIAFTTVQAEPGKPVLPAQQVNDGQKGAERGEKYSVVWGVRLLHFKAIVAAAGNPSMRQSCATVQPATATAFVSLLHCVAQITFVIVTVMRIEFSLQLATARTVGCVLVCVCVQFTCGNTKHLSHVAHTISASFSFCYSGQHLKCPSRGSD